MKKDPKIFHMGNNQNASDALKTSTLRKNLYKRCMELRDMKLAMLKVTIFKEMKEYLSVQ